MKSSLPKTPQARSVARAIVSRNAKVDGIKLHYLTAGKGPALILLHGYTQTSRMWRPIIPLLAQKFTVIAPDLPGIGDSSIPADGLDMKTAAVRIHALAKSLGVEKARVVGHDIGLMVAYAYAAQFPTEVEKLAEMDAFLPGVDGWKDVYNNPGHLAFPLQRPDPRSVGAWTRAHILRLFLERLCRRQDPFDSESRSRCIRGRLRSSGAHACGLGILRFVSASGRGLRAARADQADIPGSCDRGREGKRKFTGATIEIGGDRRDRDCPEEYRTLGAGGTPEGDD